MHGARHSPDLPKRIHILEDRQYYQKRAQDIAAEKIEADKAKVTGVRGFCLRYIKHNLFEDYTRQREYYRQLDKIRQDGNPYSTQRSEDPRAFADVARSTLERFDFEDEQDAKIYLKQGAGEYRDRLDKSDVRHTQIVRVISNYAEGLISDEATLLTRVEAVVYPDGRKDRPYSAYINDVVEVANMVRANIGQYRALGRLEDIFEIYIGEAAIGASTESYQSRVDKMVEWISSKKVLNIISQETLASAIAIASAVGVQAGTRAAQGAAFSIGSVFGTALLGGAIGGLRDRSRFNRELRQHMRDKIQGREAKDANPNSKRAGFEKEKVLFETKDATIIITDLETALANYSSSSSEASLNALLSVLGESRARTHFEEYGFVRGRKGVKAGDEDNIGTRIDLISYPDVTQVSILNDKIRVLQAQITRRLRQDQATSTTVQNRIPGSLDDFLDNLKEIYITNLTEGETGIAHTVGRIEKMRGKRFRTTASKAAVIGLVVGTIGQELGALASSKRSGIIENLYGRTQGANSNPEQQRTLLAQALDRMAGRHIETPPYEPIMKVSETVGLAYPKGTIITEIEPDTYTITTNGRAVSGIRIDNRGNFDTVSQRKLADLDIRYTKTEWQPVFTKTTNPLEYLQDAQDNPKNPYHKFAVDIKTINRAYDQEKLIYDKFKISWKGNGADLTGHISAPSVRTPEGVDILNDPGILPDLKILLTINGESGHKIIEIPVQASGDGFDINIPKNHPAYPLFEQKNGIASFKGLQVELAQAGGTAGKDNIYQIFGRETRTSGLDQIKEMVAAGKGKGVKIIFEPPMSEKAWDIPYTYPGSPIRPMGETKKRSQTTSHRTSGDEVNALSGGESRAGGADNGSGPDYISYGGDAGHGPNSGYGNESNTESSDTPTAPMAPVSKGGRKSTSPATMTAEEQDRARQTYTQKQAKEAQAQKERAAQGARKKAEEKNRGTEEAAKAATEEARRVAEEARKRQEEAARAQAWREARQKAEQEQAAREREEKDKKEAEAKERKERHDREEAERDAVLLKEYQEWKRKIKKINLPTEWAWTSLKQKEANGYVPIKDYEQQAKLGYHILRVSETASRAETLRAYRNLSDIYHPDKARRFSKAPDFITYAQIAEENFKIISSAKEKIDEYRNKLQQRTA